jgi:hypothetical protein
MPNINQNYNPHIAMLNLLSFDNHHTNDPLIHEQMIVDVHAFVMFVPIDCGNNMRNINQSYICHIDRSKSSWSRDNHHNDVHLIQLMFELKDEYVLLLILVMNHLFLLYQ